MKNDNIGRAALVSLNFDTGEQLYTIFTEEDDENPIGRCHAMKESIRDDFPEFHFGIISNERARELSSDALLRSLGIRTASSTLGDGELEESK